MGLVIKNRKKTILIALLALIMVSSSMIIFPTNSQLIMTPSTHENITYLPIDKKRLKENRTVRFAVYDSDCQYVQLCFAISKKYNAFVDAKDIILSINDEPLQEFSFVFRPTWKKEYIILLIDEIEPNTIITVTYGSEIITIGQDFFEEKAETP